MWGTKFRVTELSTYFDFSLSIRLLSLVASKSAGISVYHNHDSFVFTSRFFGSIFTILTTFQIGILARTKQPSLLLDFFLLHVWLLHEQISEMNNTQSNQAELI